MIALAKSGARLLTGLTVLDTPNFLAAPMCPMFLADFGVDVTQVERPQSGDKARYWGEARNGVGLCCYVHLIRYPNRSPLLLRSEPNYDHQQSTQPQEMQL